MPLLLNLLGAVPKVAGALLSDALGLATSSCFAKMTENQREKWSSFVSDARVRAEWTLDVVSMGSFTKGSLFGL